PRAVRSRCVARSHPARHVRARLAPAERPGRRRSPERRLHNLPRPPAAPGVQHGPPQRSNRAVRQLPALSLLRAESRAAGRPRTREPVNPANPRTREPANPDSVVAYIDGGARGNPGPAGFGVRIERPDGTLVEEFGGSI